MSIIKQYAIATVFLLSIAQSTNAQEKLGHYAGDSAFRVSIGVLSLDGSSQYWEEKERDFTAVIGDYDDVVVSGDYLYFVSSRVGILGSFSVFEGSATQSYRDFVDNFGGEISHVTQLQTASLDFGLIVHLLGSRAAVMPYLGAGGSFVSYELEEEGEFIDFGFSTPEVIADRYRANGDTFGFFWLVGIEVPLGASTSLFAEAKWRSADVELSQDFAGLGNLDLSGRSFSAGVSWSF
jgi:hypothetical protein